MRMRPNAIVSGGQTGVDRAALDAVIDLGIPTGGFIPAAKMADDGRIPDSYQGLAETDSSDPSVRTELNVRNSDATLVLVRGALTGGTLLSVRIANRIEKPLLIVNIDERGAVDKVEAWLSENSAGVLNISGPRESEDAGIYAAAKSFIDIILR